MLFYNFHKAAFWVSVLYWAQFYYCAIYIPLFYNHGCLYDGHKIHFIFSILSNLKSSRPLYILIAETQQAQTDKLVWSLVVEGCSFLVVTGALS